MSETLANRPKIVCYSGYSGVMVNSDKICWFDELNDLMKQWDKWRESFEKRMRKIHEHPLKWITENKDEMMKRYKCNSFIELPLANLLEFFIEKEVLGEKAE